MDIAKFLHPFHLLAAGVLAAVLLSPCSAHAVSIGEVVLQSKLGDPLYIQVELTPGSGEHIDASCLSLMAPDPQDEESGNYLLKAKLEIKTEGARRYAIISSHKAFNELFAKIRLQVKCSGMASIVKTLTILPDLETTPPVAISAPVTGSPAVAGQAPENNAPAVTQDNVRNMQPDHAAQQPARPANSARSSFDAEEGASKVAPPARKRFAQASRKKPERQPTFRLKLSGEPIDESRIGKISMEERELLRARQKLFDADDQMASFLAMQHQVKQLQDELGEIKLKLAALDKSPPAAAAPAPPVTGASGGASAPADARSAAAVKKPPVTERDNSMLQRGLLGAGVVMVITALLLLRRHARLKPQQAAKPEPREMKHMLVRAAEKNEPLQFESPGVAAHVSATPPSASMEMQAVKLPKPEALQKISAPQRTQPGKEKVEASEEELMMEEAELYAVHGHPNKAIEILHEIIAQNPAHTEARMLLISILSSLGRAKEFEQAARDFFQHNENSESWKMVQTLGRTLDQGNPLYAGDGNLGMAAMFLPQIAVNKRRPVGDILIEMGALSEQRMKDCLTDFNPKVHGRFGGYLVSRKLITLSQLNEALLKQQGADAGGSGVLPTLQDMENFLAEYDPERDGSIGDFLVTRRAITSEQLDKVLQQQPGDEKNIAGTPTPPPASPPKPDQDKPFDYDWEKFHHP